MIYFIAKKRQNVFPLTTFEKKINISEFLDWNYRLERDVINMNAMFSNCNVGL